MKTVSTDGYPAVGTGSASRSFLAPSV